MTITVDWLTKTVQIPQADLPHVSGTVYELDLDDLRVILSGLEASEEGISFDDIHRHSAPVTIAGVTLARVVEIINGYQIEFEDLAYGVNIVGGNSNVADVLVRNQVSVNTANSAGLIYGGADGFTSTDRSMLRRVNSKTSALLGEP